MSDVSSMPSEALSRAARVAAELRQYDKDFQQATAARFQTAAITAATPLVHQLADKLPGIFDQVAQTIATGAKKGFER